MSGDYLDLNDAMKFILEVAKKRKITKRELSAGVYEYSSFIKMCNGKKQPTLQVLLLCAEKLEIPFYSLFNYIGDKEYIELEEKEKQFERIILTANFSKLEELLNNLKNKHIERFDMLYDLVYAFYLDMIKNDESQAILKLEKIVQQFCFEKSLANLDIKCLNRIGVNAINLLIVLYFKQKKYRQSEYYFQSMVENYPLGKKDLLIKTYISGCELYLSKGDYKKAMVQINKANDICSEYLYLNYVPVVFFFESIVHDLLGNEEEAKLKYGQTLEVFSYVKTYAIDLDFIDCLRKQKINQYRIERNE